MVSPIPYIDGVSGDAELTESTINDVQATLDNKGKQSIGPINIGKIHLIYTPLSNTIVRARSLLFIYNEME